MIIFDHTVLRSARRAAHMKMKDAAKELGISIAALSLKENGKSRVNADELPLLAQMYDIDVCSFFKKKK